jgi:Na+/H+ antiporter NhaA
MEYVSFGDVFQCAFCIGGEIVQPQFAVAQRVATEIYISVVECGLMLLIVVGLFLGAFCKIAKSDYYLRHVCLSVRPRGITWLPLNGFSRNLIFEYFSKICHENSSFIKI